MNTFQIKDNLYLFTSLNEHINLSFNQYLLTGEEPVLFHTGDYKTSMQLIPEIETILAGNKLSYIFISHFEADECGGLSLLLNRFPEAKPICSAITAMQMAGFGYTTRPVLLKPGQDLTGNGFRLSAIPYPSEAHLWEGVLAFENTMGALFSSDLYLRWGPVEEPVIELDWAEESGKVAPEQIPDPAAREKTIAAIKKLPVKLICTGHGPMIKPR
ncbi:MAG: oxygen-binding di-iron domain-containing protein [Bacillota bacterium]